MENNKVIQVLNRILDNYHRLCNEHLLTEGMVAEEIEALEIALNNLKVTSWTPCSEGLPKEGNTTYMTTLDYGELGRVTGQRFFYGKHIGWEDDAVIAWMPLPEPYKEQNESI